MNGVRCLRPMVVPSCSAGSPRVIYGHYFSPMGWDESACSLSRAVGWVQLPALSSATRSQAHQRDPKPARCARSAGDLRLSGLTVDARSTASPRHWAALSRLATTHSPLSNCRSSSSGVSFREPRLPRHLDAVKALPRHGQTKRYARRLASRCACSRRIRTSDDARRGKGRAPAAIMTVPLILFQFCRCCSSVILGRAACSIADACAPIRPD